MLRVSMLPPTSSSSLPVCCRVNLTLSFPSHSGAALVVTAKCYLGLCQHHKSCKYHRRPKHKPGTQKRVGVLAASHPHSYGIFPGQNLVSRALSLKERGMDSKPFHSGAAFARHILLHFTSFVSTP